MAPSVTLDLTSDFSSPNKPQPETIDRTLLLSPPSLSSHPEVLTSVLSGYDRNTIDIQMLDRLSLGLVSLPESTYETVLLLTDPDGTRTEGSKLLGRDILGKLVKALKPGGILKSQDGTYATDDAGGERREAILAGLVVREVGGMAKPSYSTTEAVPLRFNRKKNAPLASTNALNTSGPDAPHALNGKRKNGASESIGLIGVGFVGFGNGPAVDVDDDELIDEDTLLEEEDMARPIVQPPECRPKAGKRRRACKDCTCGLKEKIEAEDASRRSAADSALSSLKLEAGDLAEVDFTVQGKVGSCGNCSLGDAFRCDGCPYIGLPAFKPGEETLYTMFSAESSSHVPPPSTSLRNPRRRPRQLSAEGASTLPQAKRARSVLADDKTLAPTVTEMGHDRASSGETLGTHGRRRRGGDSMDTALREGGIGGRVGKEDGIVLTKNDSFIVTKLPGFPDYVRNNMNERLRGMVSSTTPHALLLTPTHALVWSYTTPHSSPETFCFTLPASTSNVVGSLPLGSLVSPSTSSAEPGIVVVMPSTGKVIYWDSISRAAAQDLFRRQKQGVQGSVGSLLTGETVSAIVNAEPAGFILSFSSGRIAHLSVKDGQGRPAIAVNFIRTPNTSSAGGLFFFGSLRNALIGGGWRRGNVTARAGRVTRRGEREVAVVTAKGQMQLWDVNRAGNYVLRGEADAKEEIMNAVRRAGMLPDQVVEDDLEVLDFAFTQDVVEGNEDTAHGGAGETKIIALVAYLSKTHASYALVELSVGNGLTAAGKVHTISCYSNLIERSTTSRPRIYLPIPGHTAFVVFAHAIVIVSLIRRLDSPNHQLLSGANRLQPAFQDVIDFRDDANVEIVGSGEEQGISTDTSGVEDNKTHRRRSKHPALVLLVRGGGVLRVTAFPAKHEINVDGDLESVLKSKMLKSKIEQAIFYGFEPQNPLNFAARPEDQHSLVDVEEAVLEISGEILDSTSKYIPTIAPSMDNQLHQRADALALLALHLKENYPPLSRLTKWKLLWNAEKLAAARAMWKNYDTQLKQRKPGEKRSLQSELYFMLGDHLKTTVNEEVGELDEVRQWFTRDVSRIEHIAQWLWHATVNVYDREGKKSYADLMPSLSEAQEVSLLIFESAFTFRKEKAPIYGLGNEALTGDGILAEGYEDLPEFWTSTEDGVQVTNRIVELTRNMLSKFAKYIGQPDAGPPGEEKWDLEICKKIVKKYPRHIELCQLTYLERISWLEACKDGEAKEKVSSIAEETKMQHVILRRKQIMSLEPLGLIREAYHLSEKFKDFASLVGLVITDVTKTTKALQQRGSSDEEKAGIEKELAAIAQRIDGYYQKFGHHWARALYQNYVQAGELPALMENGNDVRYQPYLASYLQSDPRLMKLRWINDVLAGKNYDNAGGTLIEIANSDEQDLWSKKVELSLGKLARLAATQTAADTYGPEEVEQCMSHVQEQLDIISIQEALYRRVAPVLHGALDRVAEVQLAMDLFMHVRTEMTTLYGRLEKAVTMLVNRQSMPVHYLIDLLTLIVFPGAETNMQNDSGQEFYMALKALRLSGVEGRKKDATEKMIWRRAYIREDWDRINNTEFQDDAVVEKAASSTAIFTTLLTGLRKGFWRTPLTNPDGFQSKEPRECLGHGINADAYDDIKDHEVLNSLLAELESEDLKLKHYLAKARLHMWAQGMLDAAAKVYSDELEREIEREKRLHDLGNMVKKGFRVGMIEDGKDAEGDVAMVEDDDNQTEEANEGKRTVRWETPGLVLKLDSKGGILYHSHQEAGDGSEEGIFEWQ
ncbi:MAG: hypothetical protein M1839_008800 [Geoglossum umbratile]|nr:MAG: hypothetical protein M1839_008800 [Geoglossum umbratile]